MWFYASAGLTVAASGFTLWSAINTKSLHDRWEQSNFDEDLRGRASVAQTRTNVAFLVTLSLTALTVGLAAMTTPWRARAAALDRQGTAKRLLDVASSGWTF